MGTQIASEEKALTVLDSARSIHYYLRYTVLANAMPAIAVRLFVRAKAIRGPRRRDFATPAVGNAHCTSLRPALAVGEMHKTSSFPGGARFRPVGVRQNVREDGRGRFELRPVLIETGFLILRQRTVDKQLAQYRHYCLRQADFPASKETPNHGKISVGIKTMNEYTPRIKP